MNEIDVLNAHNAILMAGVEKVQDDIKYNNELIAELKKADEVNPVFPPFESSCESFWLMTSTERVCALGLTAKDAEEMECIVKRMEARAYIIEEINKANKGGNGFNVGVDNWFISYNKENEHFSAYCDMGYQTLEPCFYMRESPSGDFIAKMSPYYKAYFGIK